MSGDDGGAPAVLVAVAGVVAVLAAVLPWIEGPNGPVTGIGLVVGVPTALLGGAAVALVYRDGWTTGTKLGSAAFGLGCLGMAGYVYATAVAGAGTAVPSVGLVLTVVAGAAIAVTGSVSVLLEPPPAGE